MFLGPPKFSKLIKELRVRISPSYEFIPRKSYCKTAVLMGAIELFS